jgi:hypothetical protein
LGAACLIKLDQQLEAVLRLTGPPLQRALAGFT